MTYSYYSSSIFLSIQDKATNCVRQYRQAAKMTQAELVAKVGVTRQTIIAIEKGNHSPSVLLALKLARVRINSDSGHKFA